jgi:signal transduction histidine kinase
LLLLYASVLATALENVHLREVAEDARERAEARSKAKTLFFARISHELRTPLQSVIGYLDLMRLESPEPLPARHLELLGRAVRSGEGMLGVIDDLINFSRVEVGRVRYDLRRVSVADAMASAEIVVAPIALSRRVELRVEPPAREFVRADASKLKQILINLVANAVKFTPSGGSVRVSASREGRTGKWVTVSVSDTGPGIALDKLREIFEPFVQLGIPKLDGLGGSGLGLPISREFAAAMGAELEASSDGHGSTFTLRLHRDRLSRHPRAKGA